MARFHRPNIGSIGTAGYRDAHSLFGSLVGELRQQQPLHESDRTLLRDIDSLSPQAYAHTVPALIHALSRYAPKGYHFGPNDYDTSDFGYWPDESGGRNEGSREVTARHEVEETIAAETAEQFIASSAEPQQSVRQGYNKHGQDDYPYTN